MTVETKAVHGTNSRYQLGCRCAPCRLAHARVAKDYRKVQAVRSWRKVEAIYDGAGAVVGHVVTVE